MLKTVGPPAEGIAAYRKAIALKPDLGEGVVEPRQPQDGALRAKPTSAAMRAALEESGN